jgi:hypothetical protein
MSYLVENAEDRLMDAARIASARESKEARRKARESVESPELVDDSSFDFPALRGLGAGGPFFVRFHNQSVDDNGELVTKSTRLWIREYSLTNTPIVAALFNECGYGVLELALGISMIAGEGAPGMKELAAAMETATPKRIPSADGEVIEREPYTAEAVASRMTALSASLSQDQVEAISELIHKAVSPLQPDVALDWIDNNVSPGGAVVALGVILRANSGLRTRFLTHGAG